MTRLKNRAAREAAVVDRLMDLQANSPKKFKEAIELLARRTAEGELRKQKARERAQAVLEKLIHEPKKLETWLRDGERRVRRRAA